MRPRLLTLMVGMILVPAIAVPVFAIVNGEIDTSNAHPNVGSVVITKQPAGWPPLSIPQSFSSCTLVHPRVVLTAGHSVQFLRSLAAAPDVEIGDFAVMFSTSVYEAGAKRYRVAETRIHSGFTGRNAASIDVGVLILEEAVTGIAPVTLPALGYIDALELDRGTSESKPKIPVVGYGTTTVPQTSSALPPGIRRVAQSTFKSLRSTHLMLSQNFALGEGGIGSGDSGGAAFWKRADGSHVQIGVIVGADTAKVTYGDCMRTDISDVQTFVQDAIDAIDD